MQLETTRTLIANLTYPLTTQDLLEAHGDHTIELQNGSETLREVLERLPPTTYDRPEDLFDDVISSVGHEAVGRRYYSDRDAYTLGESGPDPLSF
jgi:hypothetical protein